MTTDASPPTIVAIDGPAGAGKSTVARMVAQRLHLPYIDTGAMYRAVAFLALSHGVSLEDEEAVSALAEQADMDFVETSGAHALCLNGSLPGDALRTPEVSQGASKVSVFSGVRAALTGQQRRLGRTRGCVMEGRDVGSVVFPDAPVKVFLTATTDERVRRRLAELQAKGEDVEEGWLREEIEERDRRDASRDLAPMVPAPDAVVLATDGLTVEEVAQKIVDLCLLRSDP